MKIDDAEYRPLRRGTHAIIRQASLSGVANRYIDLQLPPGTETQTIRSGGVIGRGETTSTVDLDQLFNTFDPSTRKALSGLIRGENDVYAGRGAQAGAGWAYLNPRSRRPAGSSPRSASTRRCCNGSSARRRASSPTSRSAAGSSPVSSTTTTALARQDEALSEAVGRLPDFMRRANTTFVNLRATLDDAAPLVEESKPTS